MGRKLEALEEAFINSRGLNDTAGVNDDDDDGA